MTSAILEFSAGLSWGWSVLYAAAATAAVLGVVASAMLTLQGWESRRFFTANCQRKMKDFEPPNVAVVIPVKGVDLELEASLHALLHQDYPDYEVHLVGESEEDPAFPIVQRLMSQCKDRSVYWHAAGLAENCGQKVHNLEAALDNISDEVELVAFADSDARPNRRWLRSLVYRSAAFEGKQGATTGYRACIPARPTLANHLLYVINASVGGLMVRSGPFNMIWGGAWVTRRELLEDVRAVWRGTVSDDVIAARVIKGMGWRVGIEPRIIVPR